MEKITIVKADTQDVLGIQNVFYKTWLHTYPNVKHGISEDDIHDRFKNAFSEDTVKARIEGIKNPIKDNTLFVAKYDDKIVGVCRVVVLEEENRIQAIYVLPEFQRKGIGIMLWNKAREIFVLHKDILVNVATYNTKAIKFYERLGFVDTGKRWTDDSFKMKSGSTIPEMEMVIKGGL
jgi:GNAT superfamily N-acetyltransferase